MKSQWIYALIAVLLSTPAFAADPPRKGKKGKAAGRLADLINRSRMPAKLPAKVDQIKPYAKSKDRKNLPLANPRTLGQPVTVERLNSIIAMDLKELGAGEPGPAIPDDQYIRRAYLDLIGQLPAPADVNEYVADPSPEKKAKLIDHLLSLPQFGENWGRYWKDAISYRNTAGRNREIPFDFEPWMSDQFNKNVGWDKIVSAMLSANGSSEENPQALLLAAHDNMPAELAGETARLLLGLQISCAQCHDHPSDHWKRDQFHELAAFFGRTGIRRTPMDLQSATISEKRFKGEYRKPNLENPSDPGTITHPVFLTGQPLPPNTSDVDRRKALAEFVTTPRNPLFAKAFVNRVWASFIGTPFTPAVDDLGTEQPVAMPKTFEALSKSFTASKYDIKRLMKTVLLSVAYDRPFGTADESSEDSNEKSTESSSAGTPIRLASTQIFDALTWALGDLGQPRNRRSGANNPRGARLQNLSNVIEQTFGFDPSTDAAQIEGSIPQALLLMNNPQINARINSKNSSTVLAKLLKANPKNEDAIKALYTRTLARNPTEAEVGRCMSYINEVGNRGEAFEDILWALINTAEFLHNH